jgi:hypothetical protein
MFNWAWWYMLVVPAIQEAEVKGWLEPGIQGQPEQHNETMPQKKKKVIGT